MPNAKQFIKAASVPSRTPLMLAVLGGHTDCVLFLLEKGALPDTKDKRGSTALHRGVGQTPSISPQSTRLILLQLQWSLD